MIPQFGRLPSDEVDFDQLAQLTGEELDSGSFTGNAQYGYPLPVEWEDAAELLRWEEAALARLDEAAGDGAQYEQLAVDLEGGDDYLPSDVVGPIDVGAAGLVAALRSAGFFTYNSCRGHVDSHGNEGLPFVGVVSDAAHARALKPLVRQADVGWGLSPEGLLQVFAPSVTELHALARLIHDERPTFDALPWTPVVE
ncbi:hypothetical protein ACWFNE_09375 [Cellulomonas sp. NPDC055163]